MSISKNEASFIGTLKYTPKLVQQEGKDPVTSCMVRIRTPRSLNDIPFIAFGRNAEILCDLGKRGDRIEIVSRVEMRDRGSGMVPTFVVEKFLVFDTSKKDTYPPTTDTNPTTTSTETVTE